MGGYWIRHIVTWIIKVLIFISVLLFIAGALYLVNGSLEALPNSEQDSKAIISAIVLIIGAVVTGLTLYGLLRMIIISKHD